MTTTNDQALTAYQPMPTALLLVQDPDAMVEQATQAAKALVKVIDQTQCFTVINDRKYLQFEAWQTAGSFFGVTAQVTHVEAVLDGNGLWTGARAFAVALRSGTIVGGAQAICTRSEKTWASRDQHQIESMAQTRAMAKSLRSVLAFVVVLAGYQPTPAEEMVIEGTARVVPNANVCPKHSGRTPKEKQYQGKTYLYCTAKDGNAYCDWQVEKPRTPPARPAPTTIDADPPAPTVGRDPADIIAQGQAAAAEAAAEPDLSDTAVWAQLKDAIGKHDPASALAILRVASLADWRAAGNTNRQALALLLAMHEGRDRDEAVAAIGIAEAGSDEASA